MIFKKIIQSLMQTSSDENPSSQRRGIQLKSQREIELIRESSIIVSFVLEEVKKMVKPNVSTLQLDEYAEKLVSNLGAIPSYKGYNGFPTSTIISINNEVLHGIPNANKIIKDGDIVKIELGCCLNEYHSNKSIAVPVGSISEKAEKLIETNEEAMNRIINKIKPGDSLLDLAGLIEDIVESNGFSVVEDYTGTGIGRNLHEEPSVFNFRTKDLPNVVLQEGMTLMINPIINEGSKYCKTLEDRWTVVTKDGMLSSHLRHTVAITKSGIEVLTN